MPVLQLSLFKLEDILTTQKLLFMFDSYHGLIPDELKCLFTFNKSKYSYETLSQTLFHILKVKTSRFGLNTLRFNRSNLWNQYRKEYLPKKVLSSKISLKTFLKRHFLSNYV